MLKFKIYTFGCKSNSCDSAVLENILRKSFKNAKKDEKPDLILVNTCTVTQAADSQARQLLRRLRRENPRAEIFALGCYAKVNSKALADIGVANSVIEGFDPGKIIKEIERNFGMTIDPVKNQEFYDLKDFPGRTRAFLKIQDGCESFCTYCIVPFARGKPRSLPQDMVISQLEKFHDAGFKEVVLTGIHMGLYGKDMGTDLLSLLRRLEKESPVGRIRLSSIEPDEISDEMIELLAASNIYNRHLHLPMQSGDDYVLNSMGRRYSRRYFHDLVMKIRKAMPDCGIGTDVIAGFPGEKEENFTNTFDLISILPLSYVHIFPYSRRPKTKAFDFKGTVAQSIIKERCRRLRDLGYVKKTDFRKSLIGSVHEVLIESKTDTETGFVGGFTRNYVPVEIESFGQLPLANAQIKVVIEKVNGEKVSGKAYEKIH